MSLDRLLIQNVLLDRAKTGTFYAVSYDTNGHAVQGGTVAPESCLVNEIRSAFEINSRHGLSMQMKKSAWTFLLILNFPQETAIDEFEKDLMQDPPSVPATTTRTSILLHLAGTTVVHPPTGQSSTGTQAIVAFSAFFR